MLDLRKIARCLPLSTLLFAKNAVTTTILFAIITHHCAAPPHSRLSLGHGPDSLLPPANMSKSPFPHDRQKIPTGPMASRRACAQRCNATVVTTRWHSRESLARGITEFPASLSLKGFPALAPYSRTARQTLKKVKHRAAFGLAVDHWNTKQRPQSKERRKLSSMQKWQHLHRRALQDATAPAAKPSDHSL